MKNEPFFLLSVPEWLKRIEDDDEYSTIFTIYTEIVSGKMKNDVDEITQSINELQPDWSDDKASSIAQLIINHIDAK